MIRRLIIVGQAAVGSIHCTIVGAANRTGESYVPVTVSRWPL